MVPQGYCICCRSNNAFYRVDVEGKGVIFSYTIVHVAEERLQSEAPYTVAVIEFESGLRLLGRLTKEENDKVCNIGARVELVDWRENVPIFQIS